MTRKAIRSRTRAAVAFAAAALFVPHLCAAEPANQFFKGRTINLYIGFGGGGTYD